VVVGLRGVVVVVGLHPVSCKLRAISKVRTGDGGGREGLTLVRSFEPASARTEGRMSVSRTMASILPSISMLVARDALLMAVLKRRRDLQKNRDVSRVSRASSGIGVNCCTSCHLCPSRTYRATRSRVTGPVRSRSNSSHVLPAVVSSLFNRHFLNLSLISFISSHENKHCGALNDSSE
jgi:hypothetical protein